MGVNTDKIKKIRTFHSDVERLKPTPKSDVAINTPASSHPPTTLPPVLTAKKPTPELVNPTPAPPTEKPVAVSPPTPQGVEKKPTVPKEPLNEPLAPALLPPPQNSGLSNEMSANLGILSKTSSYNQNEKINVMDTDSEMSEGTIITDKKRERFKLLPAMVEAIKSWFSKGKENIERRVEEKRLAVPTVSTIEARKDVVKMAAKQSAQAPKDDYEKLTATLPKSGEEKITPAKPSLVISKKSALAKPSWSHYEGSEEATVMPVDVTVAKVTIPETPLAPSVIPERVIKKEEPVTEALVAVPEVKVEPVEILINSKPPEPPARQWRATPKPNRSGNFSRILFYVATVVVAIGAVGGGVMLTTSLLKTGDGLTPTTPVTPAEVAEELPLIRAAGQTKLLLPRSRTEFYKSITENSQNSGGINVIIPTTDNVAGGTPASTGDILDTLAWQASPALLRAISEINFGTLGTTPFIVLRVTSFDTALGGLLSAEHNLSEDLIPLFGEVVAGTFNVSNNSSQISPAYFEDDVVKNHDVRVLRDELEKERVVYGFVNQNTVIITTDRGAFAALAEAIR